MENLPLVRGAAKLARGPRLPTQSSTGVKMEGIWKY